MTNQKYNNMLLLIPVLIKYKCNLYCDHNNYIHATIVMHVIYIQNCIPTYKIIKNIFKNERVCRDIYQNRKSTGTRWLWQQNEIPLPHNNRT